MAGIFGGNSTTSNRGSEDSLRQLSSQFIFGRVLSIDESDTLFNGTITVELMNVRATPESAQIIIAQPFFPNFKNYPLVNEVVFLITGPTGKYANNTGKVIYYYFTSLNIWNNLNANPTPNPYNNIQPSTQKKSFSQVEAGSSNTTSPEPQVNFKPGTYFPEKGNIFPLYPFEGDVIFEGRWGNSIRFGSTNTIPNIISSGSLNSWSTPPSQNGDPITILRNGQNINLTGSAQNLTVENINRDLSSVYLTSTQQIPISIASTNDYNSYPTSEAPTTPNQYSDNQVIINSGRLVFNSKNDHILLSSNKSINLNSQTTINLDSKGDTIISSAQVLLGSKDAVEPVLLGNQTIDLLRELIQDLSKLTAVLSTQIVVPVGSPLEPTNTQAKVLRSKLNGYLSQLDDLKSDFVKTI